MAHWQVNRNTATKPKLEFIQNKISVMTQACHAATAILHITREDKNTQEYLADLDNMHKVVLETKNEGSLDKLADVLSQHQIPYKRWIEQPENIPTALATAPLRGRSPEVQEAFKKFCSLYR
ncbi:hypothetical protein BCV71DRAFT_183527 [Rhizopus microsporus]|uniref:peptidyl-tRNA hydrolase n=1 Tax=Rhizopus microsporus TaxID=58291 RepID=A0A1X0RWV0_RHIZD|nr:hypothetical protein BCV71DRAFT_183527 [Rhizopus microsporus]